MEEFLQYLLAQIEKINLEKEKLKKLIDDRDRVYDLIGVFEGSLDNFSLEDNKDFLFDLFGNNANKIEEMISNVLRWRKFLNNKDLQDEKQIILAIKDLESVILSLNNLYNRLDNQISKLRRADDINTVRLSDLYSYLASFDENGQVKLISPDEFYKIGMFIIQASISSDKKELIYDKLYNSLLIYQKQRLELMDAYNVSVVNDNSEDIADMINERSKDDADRLSDEEENIINQIKSLISEVKKKLGINSVDLSKFSTLLDNKEIDYNVRMSLYSGENLEEKWALILCDLNNYLLPAFKSNKTEVLKIFNEILKIYGMELANYVKPEEKKYELSSKDKKNLDNAVDLIESFRDEMEKYENYSDADKDLIMRMYDASCKKNYELYRDVKFTYTYSRLIVKIKELKKNVNEFYELHSKKDKLQVEMGDDYILYLNGILFNIKVLSKDIKYLKEQYDLINGNNRKNNTFTNPVDNASLKDINMIVFLNNSNENRESYVDEDLNTLFKRKKEMIDSVKNGIRELKTRASTDIHDNSKPVESSNYYISKVVKPRARRQSDDRITYHRIPLKFENIAKIKEVFGIDVDAIYLILSFGIKADEKLIYENATRRINVESKQIEYLDKIFGEPFTDETLEIARKILQDGLDISEQIKNKSGGSRS